MQTVCAVSRVPEPIPENFKNRGPLNAEALEEYAQHMAENIMHSFIYQMEKMESEVSCCGRGQEMLAEELTLAVIERALEEVSLAQNVKDQIGAECDNVSFVGKCEEEEDLFDTDMDQYMETQNFRAPRPSHPPLSQSGLPIVGSLDYPDAPPTTPLVPELERSRSSFARKLKGGLAKVFLPSPPPSTPKDKEESSDGVTKNPEAELMEHLMYSLSTTELARDAFEGGSQHGASMDAFAEILSCEIVDWVRDVKSRKQKPHESSVYLLAQQMAETIIASSLDKTKLHV
ncbi:uncharacterized protein si:dkey-171c9.3 [Cololabis saira]|uniref:uncharacterized protein si:dkey-171c9.3 n=1 Tax=Cololabis saira TaxID=129043 RepID=UPI002AD3691A|nr:uncharacterized protein si:dkey-171c9.3 [Cololabis saira]